MSIPYACWIPHSIADMVGFLRVARNQFIAVRITMTIPSLEIFAVVELQFSSVIVEELMLVLVSFEVAGRIYLETPFLYSSVDYVL